MYLDCYHHHRRHRRLQQVQTMNLAGFLSTGLQFEHLALYTACLKVQPFCYKTVITTVHSPLHSTPPKKQKKKQLAVDQGGFLPPSRLGNCLGLKPTKPTNMFSQMLRKRKQKKKNPPYPACKVRH